MNHTDDAATPHRGARREPMQLVRPDGAARFLELATPLLVGNEVENGVMIGVANDVARLREQPVGVYWAVVMKGGGPVASAMRTGAKLLVSTEGELGATAVLAADAVRDGTTRVLGPEAAVRAFARAASESTGVSWRPGRSHRIYVLRRVTPAPPTTGEWRVARVDDTEVLARWMRAFMEESGEPREADAVLGERSARRVAEGSMYVWSDGGVVVSMAAGVGETPNGMRIGAVYTPPEARGRGYATALVAAVSQHLLDRGRAFTYLYTDLANPTSNSIYQKIGYRPVADPLELWVDAS